MRTFKSMDEFREYANKISWKYKFSISKYNEDYSIDVNTDVHIVYVKYLKYLPIKFNIALGDFNCANNDLISLEGCPKYVGGDFYCFKNQLTSLDGAPKYIGGNFGCYCYGGNQFTSLKGAPEVIRGQWVIEEEYRKFPEYQRYLLVKKIEDL